MPDLLPLLRQWVINISPRGAWYSAGLVGFWYLYLGNDHSYTYGNISIRLEELVALLDDAQAAPELRAEIGRLRGALSEIEDGCRCVQADQWAVGQCSCQTAIARAALAP